MGKTKIERVPEELVRMAERRRIEAMIKGKAMSRQQIYRELIKAMKNGKIKVK